MMSEAELHVLKERMYQGKLDKARRGALMGVPPIGYIRPASGEWAIDPDEQVQSTVRLIFDQFDRATTWHGLLRHPVYHRALIPVRARSGPGRGLLEWRRPNRTTPANRPHHPCHAGAYRFGHRPIDPRRKRPGRPTTGGLICRPEECPVPIRDRLPAYITWDRSQADRDQLDANRAREDSPGAPRQGASLLSGLPRCGRCGRRMIVPYSGPKNRHACNCTRGTADYGSPLCRSLSGPAPDDLIAGRVLAAVGPAALEASLAAVADVERERADPARHRQPRRERAALEVDRAARPYQARGPGNGLVGRELERRREESLGSRRQVEEEYERWQRTAPGRSSPDDGRTIRSLAADPPSVWRAATTTPAERQQIVRLLIEHVSSIIDKAGERADVEPHGIGGDAGSHVLSRPVRRHDPRADYPRLISRLRTLLAEGLSAAAIAERLNEEGFRPPRRVNRSNRGRVQRLPGRLEPAHRKPHGHPPDLVQDEYRPGGLARRREIAPDTVRRRVRAGWPTSGRDARGRHVIWADAAELARLRELHVPPRTRANKGRLAELTKPKPRPVMEAVEARLMPRRAAPPRSWRALWLADRGDVLEAQGVVAIGGGEDGRCGVRGDGDWPASGDYPGDSRLVRVVRLPLRASVNRSRAPSSLFPRARTLWTNSKDPRYSGKLSWEIPRWGRSHERSSDQDP